jgi:hypothetical protein
MLKAGESLIKNAPDRIRMCKIRRLARALQHQALLAEVEAIQPQARRLWDQLRPSPSSSPRRRSEFSTSSSCTCWKIFTPAAWGVERTPTWIRPLSLLNNYFSIIFISFKKVSGSFFLALVVLFQQIFN